MRKRTAGAWWVLCACVFALVLALVPGAAPPAVGAQAEPDADAVLAAVTEYQKAVDAQWTDTSGAAGSSSAATSAQESNQRVRDDLAEAGSAVTSAESRVGVGSAVFQDDGTVLARVTVSTTKTYEGSDSPGIVTDPHEMTLAGSDADGYSVVEDVVVDDVPQFDPEDVPEGFDPQKSSDNREEASPQPAYNDANPNVENMVNYVLTWTSAPYAGDEKGGDAEDEDHDGDNLDFNPDYPVANNNCANFASQALRAGGWRYNNGVNPFSTELWAPDLVGPANESRTWVNASYQYTYVRRGAYEPLDNLWNAGPGDLLYTDWDPDNVPDGTIDHVMIVTGVDASGMRYVSQKTPNRHNIPILESFTNAYNDGKTDVDWYGLTVWNWTGVL